MNISYHELEINEDLELLSYLKSRPPSDLVQTVIDIVTGKHDLSTLSSEQLEFIARFIWQNFHSESKKESRWIKFLQDEKQWRHVSKQNNVPVNNDLDKAFKQWEVTAKGEQ